MRVADLQDGLLALLDVLDQLDGALVALLDVIARVFVVGVLGQQALVRGIQAKLRHVFVVHHDQPLVAVLHESDIGLDQPRLRLVVAQAGTRIEGADVVERLLHRFDRTPNRLGDFLDIACSAPRADAGRQSRLHRQNLRSGFSVAVPLQLKLLLMVAQLVEQALAQIAAGDAGGIQLAHDFDRFVQIGETEAG